MSINKKEPCKVSRTPCSPSGKGPACSNATNLSGADGGKAECEENVKEQCDERYEECRSLCDVLKDSCLGFYEQKNCEEECSFKRLVALERCKTVGDCASDARIEYFSEVAQCEVENSTCLNTSLTAYRNAVAGCVGQPNEQECLNELLQTHFSEEEECNEEFVQCTVDADRDYKNSLGSCGSESDCQENAEEEYEDCKSSCEEQNRQDAFDDETGRDGPISYIRGEGQYLSGDPTDHPRDDGFQAFHEPGAVDVRNISLRRNRPNQFSALSPRTPFYCYEIFSKCVSECYLTKVSNCDKAHCECSLLDCGNGIDITPVGFGDPVNPTDSDDDQEARDPREVSFRTVSQYGAPIELVYTRALLPGNVLWMSEIRKEFQSFSISRLVDGVAQVTSYSEDVQVCDLYIGVCSGEIDALSSITATGAPVDSPYTFYKGSESQKVDPTQSQTFGFGRVPAYRGISSVKLSSFPIGAFTEFPEFSFEVLSDVDYQATTTLVEDVVATGSDEVFFVAGAQRALINKGTDYTVVDTLTGEALYSETSSYPNLEPTFSGKWLVNDSGNLRLDERTFGVRPHSVPLVEEPQQTFMSRISDTLGNEGLYFVYQGASKQLYFQQFDDVSGEFYTDSLGQRVVPATEDFYYTNIAESTYDVAGAVIDTFARSLFFIGVDYETFGLIRIKELRMIADPNTNPLFEEDLTLDYTISAVELGNPLTLTIQAVQVEKTTGALVVFYTTPAGSFFFKWTPTTATITALESPALSFVSKYASSTNVFKTVTVDSSVVRFNLNDMTWAIEDTGVPASLGLGQQFDEISGNLYYVTSLGKSYTQSALLANTVPNTVEDVVLDICDRAGVDISLVRTYDLSNIQVAGFRSGTTRVASDILLDFMEFYNFFSTSGGLLEFYKSPDADTVDPTTFIAPLQFEIDSPDIKDESYSVTYYNSDTGLQEQQVFDSDFEANFKVTKDVQNVSFNFYTSPEEALILAERFSYEARKSKTFLKDFDTLPINMYLEAGSVVTTTLGDHRITKFTLGADNSVSIDTEGYEATSDSSISYSTRRSVETVNQRLFVGNSVFYPFLASARALYKRQRFSAGVFLTGVAYLKETGQRTTMGAGSTGRTNVVATAPFSANTPAAWGRIVTPPTPLDGPAFSTLRDQSFSVRMYEEEYADRVAASPSAYAEGRDERYYNREFNLLLVGQELLQFAYAEKDQFDPNVVTFYDLQRARNDTDREAQVHQAGDTVVWLEEGRFRAFEGDEGSFGAISVNTKGYYRRSALDFDQRLRMPEVYGHVLRFDTIHSPVSRYDPPNILDNPNIKILSRARGQTTEPFDEESLTFNRFDSGRHYAYKVYFLSAPYDPDLFLPVMDDEVDFLEPDTYVLSSTLLGTSSTSFELENQLFAGDSARKNYKSMISGVHVVFRQVTPVGEQHVYCYWEPGVYQDKNYRPTSVEVYTYDVEV